MESKRVFVEDTKVETQTVFRANGNIQIFPCFNETLHLVPGYESVILRGRMFVDDDANAHFVPYVKTGKNRRSSLFETPSGWLKRTQKHEIVELRWKRKLTLEQKREILLNEIPDILQFLETVEGGEG